MSLTGVARSDDRLVKVVVGPRGQLVDLDIDPRVFRRPDVEKLKGTIMATAAAAIHDVSEQAREIMAEQIPPEIGEWRSEMYEDGGVDPIEELLRSDAEIVAGRGTANG